MKKLLSRTNLVCWPDRQTKTLKTKAATGRDRERQEDRQTDRPTDRQTHTHTRDTNRDKQRRAEAIICIHILSQEHHNLVLVKKWIHFESDFALYT